MIYTIAALLLIIVLLPRALAVVYVILDECGMFMLKAVGILILLFLLVLVYEEAIGKPNGVLKFANRSSEEVCYMYSNSNIFQCAGAKKVRFLPAQQQK